MSRQTPGSYLMDSILENHLINKKKIAIQKAYTLRGYTVSTVRNTRTAFLKRSGVLGMLTPIEKHYLQICGMSDDCLMCEDIRYDEMHRSEE